MRRFPIYLALAACVLPTFAQHVPIMTAEETLRLLPEGATLGTRVDGDLNGDGETDTAFLWHGHGPDASDEERGLKVMLAYRSETELGRHSAGELSLNPFPQVPGSLSIRKGVLVLEDLTGGTTATRSTRRYRYDAKQEKMRLIGIDAQRYSRTNSHGSVKISWNLLDGTHVLERGEPDASGKGEEALVYAEPERTSRKSLPVWIENTPDPDELLDAEIVSEGEDRD